MKSEEQCLVRRLRNGENEAMRDFYALYANYLTGICSRYVADDEDTKDVLQNTLVRIFTKISDFDYRGEGSLRAWAAKIAVNESLSFLKTRKRNELFLDDVEVADEPEKDDPPISNIPPEEIHRMVSELPTGYRAVFNLYVFEDKTHREIAQLLGIKIGTSTSQLHRAKNLLAKMIQTYYKNHQHARQ